MTGEILLPGNKTYWFRRLWWLAAHHPGLPVVGRATLREAGGRFAKKGVTSRYAVRELAYDSGRRFRFLKRDGTVYYSHLPPWGVGHPACVCTGFEHYGRCKHLEVLSALEARGMLPWVHQYPLALEAV